MLPSPIQRLRAHWGVALLVVAVALHLLLLGSLFWGYLDAAFSDVQAHEQGIDFFGIYEAGHNTLEGRSVYHFDASDVSETPYHTPYRYVPVFAYAVGVPLNVLPHWSAYWFWVSVNELLLVLTAYATWRIAGRGNWALAAAAMWFTFTPYYVELYMGQFSFLMAALLFWTGVGFAKGKEALAGLPWVLSLVTKSVSGLLLPAFARVGWWRSIAVGAGALALNVPYFVLRPRDFAYFVRINFAVIHEKLALLNFEPRPGETYFFVDFSIRGWAYSPGDLGAVALVRNVYLSIDAGASDLPAFVPLAIMVAVAGYSLAATFLPRTSDTLALFAIWVLSFAMIYVAWEHHYVMLLPALVLLVALRPAGRPVVLVAFVLLALPTPYWFMERYWHSIDATNTLVSQQESWPAWGVLLHHASKVVPVVGLWGYLTTAQLRSGVDVARFGAIAHVLQRVVPARREVDVR